MSRVGHARVRQRLTNRLIDLCASPSHAMKDRLTWSVLRSGYRMTEDERQIRALDHAYNSQAGQSKLASDLVDSRLN